MKQVASLLAYQKIMSYKQVYEVLAQGDQCGSAVGQQEITKKKKKNEDACLDMSVAMVSWSSRKFAGGRQPVW